MEKQTLGMSSSLLGKENTSKNKIDKIVGTALKGIGLASISISMLKDK